MALNSAFRKLRSWHWSHHFMANRCPPGADTRPAPPGFAPPLPRSRGAAHLHQWLSVSPVPTPGSRAACGPQCCLTRWGLGRDLIFWEKYSLGRACLALYLLAAAFLALLPTFQVKIAHASSRRDPAASPGCRSVWREGGSVVAALPLEGHQSTSLSLQASMEPVEMLPALPERLDPGLTHP